MAKTSATKLDARLRTAEGSRAVRRLRRAGRVPGVLYGGGEDPIAFDVDARELRQALAAAGAVFDVAVDGQSASAVVKQIDRHPVRGETLHVDLLRVRLDQPIQAVVHVEFLGTEDAPGVREGGVLEQVIREVTIEALPTDIPESIQHDVSGLAMHDTVQVSHLSPPSGVTLLDDPETVLASLIPPRLEAATEEEIEQETALVGEAAGAEAGGEAAAADEEAKASETTSE